MLSTREDQTDNRRTRRTRPRAKPIYVEIRIRAPLEELWCRTQTPELHQRWDLRFTKIEYLPRPDVSQPQHFLYETRIGFGIVIRGEGSSVGTRHGPEGTSSVLKFWSDDPRSLIRSGSGYWKYVPTDDGIRFVTLYSYETRFGAAGRWVDARLFRPVMGWATAWSFDRLRLWLERGIDPSESLRRALIYAVARLALSAIWIYQGLVPKLLFVDSGELDLIQSSGQFPGWERRILTLVGLSEIAFGIVLLTCWNRPRLLLLNVFSLMVLAIGAALYQPAIFSDPFNPSTLTLSMIALAVVGLLSYHDLPSARTCVRNNPGDHH